MKIIINKNNRLFLAFFFGVTVLYAGCFTSPQLYADSYAVGTPLNITFDKQLIQTGSSYSIAPIATTPMLLTLNNLSQSPGGPVLPNNVYATFSLTSPLPSGYVVSELAFNLDPALNPEFISASSVSNPGPNAFTGAIAEYYPFVPGIAGPFNLGLIPITYWSSGTAYLDVSYPIGQSFSPNSLISQGNPFVAALNTVDPSTHTRVWYLASHVSAAAPEVHTYWLLAGFLAFALLLKHRLRKKLAERCR